MSTRNIFVTGAGGFIGTHLVRRLVARGDKVTCLARTTSNISVLEKMNCSIAYGDTVKDPEQIALAIKGHDVVFHLAASAIAVHARDLVEINTTGFENVLKACAACPTPPELVFVSSLAAVGPSSDSRPHRECDLRKPVSFYGRSKADCEIVAQDYSAQVPISVVRPPIVLGEADRRGLIMFRMIDKWRLHVVPDFADRYFSMIHVDDLVTALIGAVERGKRLSRESEYRGIYFASADEIVTYAEFGKMIGQAFGQDHTRILRVGKSFLKTIAAINEVKARLTSKPQYLNLDKVREGTAGSWSCSNAKIKNEIGFAPARTMLERLQQTADWYRQQGWLNENDVKLPTNKPRPVSGA